MEQITAVRNIGTITAEFLTIKRQTEVYVLNAAIEMGRRLSEAKMLLNHGEFGNWLKEEAEISHSTAENMMRIFKEYGADEMSLFGASAKSQTYGNLSVSKALALLAVPENEREDFAASVDAENLSTREIREAIKERNEAAEEKLAAEAAAEEYRKRAEELELSLEAAREDAEGARTERDLLYSELQEAKDAESSETESPAGDIEKARKEAAAEAKAAVKEEAKKKLEKAETAIKKAEEAAKRLEAEKEELKADYERREQAAQGQNKALAEKVSSLEKQMTVSASTELTAFKLHFEAAKDSVNKMLESMAKLDDETKPKLKAAVKAFCEEVVKGLEGGIK